MWTLLPQQKDRSPQGGGRRRSWAGLPDKPLQGGDGLLKNRILFLSKGKFQEMTKGLLILRKTQQMNSDIDHYRIRILKAPLKGIDGILKPLERNNLIKKLKQLSLLIIIGAETDDIVKRNGSVLDKGKQGQKILVSFFLRTSLYDIQQRLANLQIRFRQPDRVSQKQAQHIKCRIVAF